MMAGGDADARTMLAMGEIAARLQESMQASRAEFATAFASFGRLPVPHRMALLTPGAVRHRDRGSGAMRVVATYNIKGGVGKTSAAVNLGYLAARDGLRTLIWDLDPQGSATYLFRIKPKVKGGGKALVAGRRTLDEAIKETDFERLDLMPADFSYRNLDLDLDSTKRPTDRLRRLVAPLDDEYELVILDCPPSVSLVSENVVRASDVLLVPLIPAVLSLRTFDQLTDFVDGTARSHAEGAGVPVDGRPAQEGAPGAGRAAAVGAEVRGAGGDPEPVGDRADGPAPRSGAGLRAAQPGRRRVRRPLDPGAIEPRRGSLTRGPESKIQSPYRRTPAKVSGPRISRIAATQTGGFVGDHRYLPTFPISWSSSVLAFVHRPRSRRLEEASVDNRRKDDALTCFSGWWRSWPLLASGDRDDAQCPSAEPNVDEFPDFVIGPLNWPHPAAPSGERRIDASGGGDSAPRGRPPGRAPAAAQATDVAPGRYRAAMKAAVYDRYGPPEVVRVLDVPTPVAADDEVLVRSTRRP